MSDQRYNTGMKRLNDTLKISNDDIAAFRLKVLECAKKHDIQVALDTFGVKRSTYYDWKKLFDTGGCEALIPKSTRPDKIRTMQTDPRIIEFIADMRKTYGNIGREKIKPFLDEYALKLGIESISPRTIGKIINRYHLFEPGRKTPRHYTKDKIRARKAPKIDKPGFIEVDSVKAFRTSRQYLFVCCIDIFTKYAYVHQVSQLSSANALKTLQEFQAQLPYKICTVQTDNGSEFMKYFDQELKNMSIPHYFTLVCSPKINGCIERFNRTFQEEFLDRTDTMTFNPKLFTSELNDWLSWYNECRPHAALNYKSPCEFLEAI